MAAIEAPHRLLDRTFFIVLVAAVLTNHLWAYPWMIAFLAVFIAYQGYELVVAFTWGLLLLTLFDVLILGLTWREYGLHRLRRQSG